MRDLEVTLIEWPEGRDRGGPRLLGMSVDEVLVAHVRDHLAAQRRQELARLAPPVRAIPDDDTGGGGET